MGGFRDIGTVGEYTVLMSFEELCKIADKELKAKIDKVVEENNRLYQQLGSLITALKFYAADENYYMHRTYGNTNVQNDNGKIAKECLNALHVD